MKFRLHTFTGLLTLAVLLGTTSCTTSTPSTDPADTATDPSSSVADTASAPDAAANGSETATIEVRSDASEQSESPATETAGAIAQASITAGSYCYDTDTETLSRVVRLTVDNNQQVTGDSRATIQNEAAGYYSSYAQQLKGTLADNRLEMDVDTWIEYDFQETQETWTMTPTELTTDRDTLMAVDCEMVRDRFADANGLEAKDLTEGATAVHEQRVQFASGTSSATLENSVIRGERDVYLLNAQGGQLMQVFISALEDNAAFDVVSPSGYILLTEGQNESVLLPETGDYQIIVGGTRGNATYTLDVAIE
jgi:hypothetical protein